MKKGDHLFLVDGSGYIFRAYHALPPLTRKSDGLPTSAVLGFCNMVWKLTQDARNTDVGIVPTHFAVIFDYSSKTFRNDFYPEYKANRSAPPEDLIPQFGLIRQATRAFNLPCIEMEGFEADDLIATYCRLACEAGGDTTIISSDKDLMQLVGATVSMYDPMKDRQIGVPEVIEKWGVPPEKMIDLQALTGDSVDNVPGVPGIGPKTAAQLLEQFGDLDGLLARAGEIKQDKRRESIIANADKARISRHLVTLKNDVPVTEGLDDFVLHAPDGPKLIGFLKTMEFSSLTRRVAEATGTEAGDVPATAVVIERADTAHGPDVGAGAPAGAKTDEATEAAPATSRTEVPKEGDTPSLLSALRLEAATASKIDTSAYVSIRDAATLKAWVAEAMETGVVAFATETTSLDPMRAELIGVSMATAPGRAAYVPLAHKSGNGDLLGGGLTDNQIPVREALAVLKPLLEDRSVLKIVQELKYHLVVMSRHGIDVAPFDDTMLISYVLDAGTSGGHGLAALSEKWLGHSPTPLKALAGSGKSFVGFDQVDIDKATAYGATHADITLRLWRVLKPRLAAKGLVSVYERLERPLVPVLARMEQRGISIDRQILSRLSGELAQGAARLEEEIYQLVGERINIGSPKQLGDILFGRMGLPGGSKTRTGQWSTSAQLLEDLAAEGHELPRKIVDWRQLTKLKSTYTDALPGFIHPDTKRVHTSYALAATTTGRLSSSDPNLQNIPVRTAEGRKIRAAFIADKGHKLVSADYSQIELRVLAHVAEIPQLKQAFADGADIHAITASEMFNVPVEGMPSEVRRRAKAINFGIIYGISAFGLANQLSIPREEAGAYIKKYFERFPGIRDYIEATKAYAREYGYVETIFGRRIHYPEIRSSNPSIRAFNERASINARLQGTAADIIRRAMIRMDDALEKAGLSARMLLQVHDELIFETVEPEVEATIPVVRHVMENAPMPAVSMSVPLHVDARAANNWDEAH
ncbi:MULTISPECIES: DNA polymerase I [unclassified Mesorhizobium]|uniref:DNA polymerase I n=1 Tax=unclassified Mesorhizobium TaxID=325217 RepID=UPI000FD7883F|nr:MULTISPECIES: DNA polymerase I [unclassified Mesorhizobium]TGQ46052.1 DNA polymerase I [Mesorhizobium sp. M00.F.Ca.ET.216.01.1.1]TIS59500.1 MAG: DNA polymerase I [Mesorhizobium sp.]TIS91223.1 MAG: DNA polymerase I [Mesorhizobium sp.]TJW05605.1 MAG: DNA polymerase I [Mesorhizobium sp.]TJW45613.1 MAG: DNA polymerase I [Mesorhizobium sp.]